MEKKVSKRQKTLKRAYEDWLMKQEKWKAKYVEEH